MKNVFIQAMNETFDLVAMLARIDYHHIRGNLTDTDREELVALARDKANPFGGIDIAAKLQEFDARITALEKKHVDVENEDAGGTEGEEIPEEPVIADYVVGKWYYAGDQVMFDGAVYECIAPKGAVCTWSPSEYPAYWQAI